MNNFTLHLSTKIFFGDGHEKEVGKIIRDYGFENILVVAGQSSVFRSGLYDIVENSLNDYGIKHHLYKGITPNPEINYVREALDIARSEKIDFILAIGGGSVIDVAKLVAVAFFHHGDPLDFNRHIVEPKASIPLGVILTHAAAGSEMSTSCVISDSSVNFKQGFNSQFNRPLFAIENPKWTLTLSKEQTGIGITDIMMHTLERFFNKSTQDLLADDLATALLKNVVKNAYRLIENPNDLEARANIMLANTFSHNGVTNMGKEQKMAVHAIEHALSGKFPNIPHGHGLAILYPAWCRYYLRMDVDKFDKLAREVFGLNHPDKLTNGSLGIKALEELFTKMGLSLNLRRFNLSKDDLADIALLATKNRTVTIYHYLAPLDYDGVMEVLEDCY